MARKVTKKKNLKLRKQIRKTVGALFMASAVVVAAIPVQDISANPTDSDEKHVKIAVYNGITKDALGAESDKTYSSSVPSVAERGGTDPIIYTSGDGTFQFAYINPTASDPNKVAVILGYNSGVLMESSLTIPDKLEGYTKYTDNDSNSGYCLVSKNNEFLYYETYVQKKDSNKKNLYNVKNFMGTSGTVEAKEVNEDELFIKDDGTRVYRVQTGTTTDTETGTETPVYIDYEVEAATTVQYNPCYYEQRSQWSSYKDSELFYKDGSNFVAAGDVNDHWKINADVAYIGGEKITDDGNGGWKLAGAITDPDDGVFAGQNNITNLTIGSNIKGIGDYAFYGCATLQSVSLANGLDTIGNGAFANCIRLESCNIASNANIKAIGKDAFYNCSSLKSFSTPIGLQALGDNCFENCTSLESVNLSSDGGAVSLRELGNHLFKGCSSLTHLEFPSSYEEDDLDIDMFEGCSSLQYIKVPNATINFSDSHDGDCCKDKTWETFISTVPSSFYFEGPDKSNIHTTATANSIAFKYLDQDLYEKIEYEHDSVKDANDAAGKSAQVTYQVNSKNELVKFWINSGDKPDNVTIPETIGPYGISSISAGSFTDNCDLVRITIPASVTEIGANAFKGCHNLKTVIFTDAATITSIGTDAFKTQEATCSDTLYPKDETANHELTFVGAMMNSAGEDTVPFQYAMNGISNINNSNQEKLWITCHSGWPTNLEVQYSYDPITNTGEAQLIGYPRYEMIKDKASAAAWVKSLPYVTSENEQEYLNMVTNATTYYQASDEERKQLTQPSENEMSIVSSTLNVVIPSSVDSIKPGLFSGYVEATEDDSEEDIERGWKKVENISLTSNGSLQEVSQPDTYIQRIVLNGVNEIEPYTFKNCTSLVEASIIGPSYIDDYAFDGLDDDEDVTSEMQLQMVTLGTNLTDTGKRPFRGCENLTTVSCLDSDFTYNNGIIYRNTGSGVEIVECLEGRGENIGSYSVGPDELTGVTSIKEEAFADCDSIGKVDLSTTTVNTIPEGCFKETDELNSVVLPDTVKSIESEAFADSNLRLLTIPGTQSYIAQDAFMTGDWVEKPSDREVKPNTTAAKEQQTIIFECIEGTTADRYAKEYWYINPEYDKVYLEHTVYFWDYPDYPDTTSKELFDKVKVKDGDDAVPPATVPTHTGYQFTRWTDYTNISRDTDVYPVFGSNVYAVSFRDYDGTLIGDIQYIEEGRSATPPEDPVRTGYTFDRWSQDWNNVTEDRTIVALYLDNSGDSSRHTVTFYDYDGSVVVTQSVNDGEAAVEPKSPTRSGYTFTGWIPSDFSNVTSDMIIVASYDKNDSSTSGGSNGSGGSGSGSSSSASPSASASASPSTSTTADVTKYTVSVSGGSGSGSYAAGDVVAINAYAMSSGQVFDKWTTSTAGVGFADANATSTTFTMPAANVAITATYKTGSSGSSSGGSVINTSSGGTSSSGNGTTVEVTKSGISNTGISGATVSGATDNFVVKVSEDQTADDNALAALQSAFGDMSRIKYFSMDISLYDSTGRTKIADTTGISVNITLPIPDDLVQYAGNNKVASVAGGTLENLNTRFTTVDGVPCINFTATHFSPYVVYVDTANLTAGTIDATPKTGDPIHPKWFLALGMACISLILFFKKDKSSVKTRIA